MAVSEPTVEPLNAPLQAVFHDGPFLDRLVRAIALDQGTDYARAFEHLHGAVDDVFNDGRPRTLGAALEATRSEAADIEANLVLLERRDSAVNVAQRREMEPFVLEQTNRDGMVLLDQGAGGSGQGPDIGQMLADPVERERRLARARRFHDEYLGDRGRERFDQEDKRHLESGLDMVRGWERGQEIRAAHANAQRVGRRLDQAISTAPDKQQRLRMLEAEIAHLDSNDWAPDAPRRDEAPKRIMLDASPAAQGEWSAKEQAIADRIRALGADTRSDWLRLLEADQSAQDVDQTAWTGVLLRVLHDPDFVRGPVATAPQPPPGVQTDVDRRVRDRMRALGRSESDYAFTLEEIVLEDKGR